MTGAIVLVIFIVSVAALSLGWVSVTAERYYRHQIGPIDNRDKTLQEHLEE